MKHKVNQHDVIRKIAYSGLMAALCYVGYAVFPAISASGSKVHIGNAFVVLAGLLLGVPYGGLAGAIGLTIADFTLGYAASAPRTFICKLLIGLIAGAIAYYIGKLPKKQPWGKVILWTVVSTVAALGFNCLFEPALKYVWYTFLIPNAEKAQSAITALMAVTTWTTLVNALINSVIAIVFYLALRPALRKLGLMYTEE